MKQCKVCKFSKNVDGARCCKKKKIQICSHEDSIQKLSITNECAKVNLLNDCELFKERAIHFLMKKLSTPDHTFLDGVKDRNGVKDRIKKIEEQSK